MNSSKSTSVITAYVAIFVFLSLSFSRLILELRKNVVLAYFNQGVAQLFFLGLYIEEQQFFSWVLRGVCNKSSFLGHCGNTLIVATRSLDTIRAKRWCS